MMDLESSVAALAPGLLRYCVAITRKRELAEEVAQEALTALVTFWRRQGPPDSPAIFVYTVARRVAWRALWRRRLFRPLSALSERPDPALDPEDLARRRDELRCAQKAIKRLPPRERQALLLVAAAELDCRTAAVLLGISRSALKMRVHRARRRLEEALRRSDETKNPTRAPGRLAAGASRFAPRGR